MAESAAPLLEAVRVAGRRVLSEHEAKEVLTACGIPVTREVLVSAREEVAAAAATIGYPLVIKACSPDIAHKTERGLVRLDVRSEGEALRAVGHLNTYYGRRHG